VQAKDFPIVAPHYVEKVPGTYFLCKPLSLSLFPCVRETLRVYSVLSYQIFPSSSPIEVRCRTWVRGGCG